MNENYDLIILVDDDEDDRDFFNYAINKLEFEGSFITLPDGTQLLNYLSDPANKVPSFIFLDINMPKLTGFETLAVIREKHSRESLPVAIYSTSNDPGDVELAFRFGANAYFKKPLETESLLTILRNTLTNKWHNFWQSPHLKHLSLS